MARRMTTVQPINQCELPDDRCERGFTPPFMPGISVKHSPSCSGEICHLFGCDGGNWRVTGQGTLDRSEWIKGWAMTQLLTRGFVDCDEHPLRLRGGGWWADSYRTPTTGRGGRGFRSGSKLWALAYAHGGATNELLVKAMDYAYEALRPLETWGIGRVFLGAQYLSRAGSMGASGAVMHLQVRIAGPGVVSVFTVEGNRQPGPDWLWNEYRPSNAAPRAIGRLHENVTMPRRT